MTAPRERLIERIRESEAARMDEIALCVLNEGTRKDRGARARSCRIINVSLVVAVEFDRALPLRQRDGQLSFPQLTIHGVLSPSVKAEIRHKVGCHIFLSCLLSGMLSFGPES